MPLYASSKQYEPLADSSEAEACLSHSEDFKSGGNAEGRPSTKRRTSIISCLLYGLGFVSGYLVHHFARPVQASAYDKEFIWCSSWWAHIEASSRLNALWRAWETLRLDETLGLADWWNNYADPTMRVLFAPKGPFQGCTAEVHRPANHALPVLPPPDGLFSTS